MKRVALWFLGAGGTAVALTFALRAQEQSKPVQLAASTTQAAPAAATPPAPADGKVAFTFSDDDQMKQFAQLWQQRQAVMTKMAVLQGYWNQEQAGLAKVNQELLAKYNLDVNKNYAFDATKKVIVERELTPEQQAALSSPGQQPPSASTTTTQ